MDSVLDMYTAFGAHADVVLLQQAVDWEHFAKSAEATSQAINDIHNQYILAHQNGLEIIFVVDPLNGLNRREFYELPFGWERSFGNPTIDDYAISLIRLRDGTYLIVGLGSGMPLTHLDKDASLLWTRPLTESRVHGAPALIELEDGGFLIAGFIQISNGRSYDAILLRTDAEGYVNE